MKQSASEKYFFAVFVLKQYMSDLKRMNDQKRRRIENSKRNEWARGTQDERDAWEQYILDNDESIASCNAAIQLLEGEYMEARELASCEAAVREMEKEE